MRLVHKIILTALHLSALTRALTYSLGQASQCGDLQVTWSDAKGGDLNLVVLPVSPASSFAQCFTSLAFDADRKTCYVLYDLLDHARRIERRADVHDPIHSIIPLYTEELLVTSRGRFCRCSVG